MASGDAEARLHRYGQPWSSGFGSTRFVTWPMLVYVAFASYPVWWAMGLAYFYWPFVTLPMALALTRVRPIRTPRYFGVWLLFLLWMLLSAVELVRPVSYVLFAYRASIYLSATTLCLYVYNVVWPNRERDVVRLLGLVWIVLVAGGLIGTVLPRLAFATPLSLSIPETYLSNQWLRYMVHPGFAEIMYPLGYAVGRPKLFFDYTNQWGGCVGILTPAALAYARSKWDRHRLLVITVAAISLIPITISLDRGLWIGLVVGVVYIGLRTAHLARARALGAILFVVGLLLAIVLLTPLGGIVDARLTSSTNSNNTRSTVYGQTISELRQSPIFGYGTPQTLASAKDSTLPAIGTQSQYGLVAYSHGVFALVLFIGWFLFTLLNRRAAGLDRLCLQAVILVGVVEMTYYDFMPTSLHIMMLVAGVLWAGAGEATPRRGDLADPSSPRLAVAGQGLAERPASTR